MPVACITSLWFTETLIVNDFTGAEETNRIGDFRDIAYNTQNIVIGGTSLLLRRHVLVQICNRIAFALKFAGIKGDAARCLGPNCNCMIDIIWPEAGIFNFFHGKAPCELMHDSCNHFKMRQFFSTQRSSGNAPVYQI